MEIYEIVYGITKESLSHFKQQTIPVRRQRLQELKPKQIENALRGFAQGCSKYDIEIFCDTSLLVNGKDGLLFSKEGIYSSKFNSFRKRNPIPQPVRYDDLSSVSVDGSRDNYLCLCYKDGHTVKVFGSIYTGFLVTALQQILLHRNKSDNPQKVSEKAISCIEKEIEITPKHLPRIEFQIKKRKTEPSFIYNNPYIPELGKIIYIQNKAHLILSHELIEEDDGEDLDRHWVEMFVRELETGKPGILTVGWNPEDTKKTYISSYHSDFFPYDTEFDLCEHRIIYGKYSTGQPTDIDFYNCLDFSLELKFTASNIKYQNSDCELRLCRYEGTDTFHDLLNDKVYSVPITEIISHYEGDDIFDFDDEYLGTVAIAIPQSRKIEDLKALKPGSIAEICLWRNQAYFAALMNYTVIDELSDDNKLHIDQNSELIDTCIESESTDSKLIDLSFFDTNSNWIYPEYTYSPLGRIIMKI